MSASLYPVQEDACLARTFTSQNLKNSDMLNDLKQVIKI
jgi:hypothetical protein